jgi:3-isopropylmalate/(R)-2-methylmalate dehydratase large subunit
VTPRTLSQKVWEQHVVHRADGEPDLLYVDLHLVHEVTSPQAFEGLRVAGRPVRRPDLTLATMDHNVVTGDDTPMDELSAQQLAALARNCEEFGVPLYATGSGREGIVHVIGPELGQALLALHEMALPDPVEERLAHRSKLASAMRTGQLIVRFCAPACLG